MNKISVSVFLALLGLLLMQLGASLFSITIAESTLVESSQSLAMTQGELHTTALLSVTCILIFLGVFS